MVIATTKFNEIIFYLQQEDDRDGKWKSDINVSRKFRDKIGLYEQGEYLLDRLISPDGNYIVNTMDGIKIYQIIR